MGNRSNIYKQLSSGNVVFPYKIGRVEYFIRGLILGVITALFSTLIDRTENLALLLIILILLILLLVASFWIQIIPRMRDLGWPLKLAWLVLIPGVNVVMAIGLLFMPPK